MLRRLVEKFRGEDKKMVEEARRLSEKSTEEKTNWFAVFCWSVVLLLSILLWVIVSR